jgi:ribosomal protein S14
MFIKKKKDFFFRKKNLKLEKLKMILSFLIKNNSFKLQHKIKFLIIKKLQRINLVSKTKIVRRCILTNRGRSSTRPFNISRMVLRELLQFSILPGYQKAVW